MIGRIAQITLMATTLVALTGCSLRMVDGQLRDVSTYYDEARATPENGNPVALSGTYQQAFTRVLGKLRAKGFEVVSADAQTGVIVVRSVDPQLLSCGELQSGPTGGAAIYDANTPLAIVEAPAIGGAGATFVRREFLSASEITIQISADPEQGNAVFASISETHSATIRMTQILDGSILVDETITFDGADRGQFSRGVICGSARAMRAAIR